MTDETVPEACSCDESLALREALDDALARVKSQDIVLATLLAHVEGHAAKMSRWARRARDAQKETAANAEGTR
jgi:hypothetical protein